MTTTTTTAPESHRPTGDHIRPGDFVPFERDLLGYRTGTVIRYSGRHEVAAVIADAGFEVTAPGFSPATWSFTDETSRRDVAGEAAQYISNLVAPRR